MKFRLARSTTRHLAVLLATGCIGTGALAASTWDVRTTGSGGGCTQATSNAGTYNNSYNCVTTGDGGNAMAVSAWSTSTGQNRYASTGGSTTYTSNGTAYYYGSGGGRTHQVLSGTSAGYTFANAHLSNQLSSGFGAASRDEGIGTSSPNHAFDSVAPGSLDLMLLDFGSTSVILDKIGIGWKGTDADITVMRWVGATGPSLTSGTTAVGGNQILASTLYNPLTPNIGGWELVGSFANLVGDTSNPIGGNAIDTGATVGSSWWLVSSFNTTLNGGGSSCKKADGSATTCNQGDDSFKLNYIATSAYAPPGETSGVPEPATAALLAMGLLGYSATRRRRAHQAVA